MNMKYNPSDRVRDVCGRIFEVVAIRGDFVILWNDEEGSTHERKETLNQYFTKIISIVR